MEQGVPVEIVDLRMCYLLHELPEDWLQSLSEVVVNVLGPETDTVEQEKQLWDPLIRGAFIDGNKSTVDIHLDTGSEDEDEGSEE